MATSRPAAAFAALALALVTWLAAPAFAAGGAVVVGSKIDTEGSLLGQMILIALAANGYDVTDRTELGGTPIVRQAILSGQIDIYPEYTGNGAIFFKDTDPAVWKDAEKAYETVRRLDREQNGLVWLKPSPANNTWAVAVRRELAEEAGLRTLEDLAAYLNRDGRIKLAGCEEFVTRPDALPAFQEAYGFHLSDSQLLILAGCNTAQTEKAAAQGMSGVNAAMAYGTDGSLAALGLVVLDDPKGVQPVYAPAPVVRADSLERLGDLGQILDPIFASLDRKTLQELNARIAVLGEEPASVARGYLRGKNFIK